MIINYAHRGASEYAPENTFAAFYLGIEMGADGIETDVRRTKDGILVLFHDDSLARITGQSGSVSDYTYMELLEMDFGGYKHSKYQNEKIVSLEDFLKYYSAKQLSFAIELKGKGFEKETLDMVYKYMCSDKTTLTSFDLENLIVLRKCNNNVKLGYLTEFINDDILTIQKDLNIQQICPKCELIDKEKVLYAKRRGFSVRCWGVSDIELMNKALDAEVDGMTVNFPDKLARALNNVNLQS